MTTAICTLQKWPQAKCEHVCLPTEAIKLTSGKPVSKDQERDKGEEAGETIG